MAVTIKRKERVTPELIKRRRSQMLIHSYLYYHLDEAIVSDDRWQEWANDLAKWGWCEIGFYDEAFKDFDGSTGYHLPADAWVKETAARLLAYHQRGGRAI
jgi:hypothetical protein